MTKKGVVMTLLLFYNYCVDAQQIVRLEDYKDHYVVDQKIDYLIDSTQHYSISEITGNQQIQHQFRPVRSSEITRDHLDDFIWIRLTLYNARTDHNKTWYFESWGFDIDQVVFFVPHSSSPQEYSSYLMGYDYAFGERNIPHKNLNMLLDIRPGETKTYYAKIRRSYPMRFSFHIRTNERFLFHSINEYLFLGLYYGFLFLIFFFGIYLTVKLKEKLYIYFSLLIAATIWYSFSRDGLGFQYLWPNLPVINALVRQREAELFLVISTLAFTSKFINNIGDYYKIKLLSWAAIILKLCVFSYEELFTPLPSEISFPLNLTILGLPFLSSLIAQLRKRQFLWLSNIAFMSLFLSFVQVYASAITIFENLVVNWYLFNAGILIEVSFFSLSIISQIVYLRKQNLIAKQEQIRILEENNRIKDELNNKLEIKVAERTKEIKKMAQDLAEKNIQLESSNDQLRVLNDQVTAMNKILHRDNEALLINIEEVNKARVLMKGVDFEEFKKIFSDKNECLKFLAELKWKNCTTCKRCGYNKFGEGRVPFGRRCKNCNYDESPTSDTLFHKLKFPIEKAFYMVYLVNRKDAEYTLNELSELLDLRRETCWAFKQKILAAMEKSGHNKNLSGWDTLTLISLG